MTRSSTVDEMTVLEKAIALRELDLFEAVSAEQLAHVAAVSREARIEAGDTLFEEGEPPGSLYIILEGAIELDRQGRSLGTAGEGEPLGTWSLFDDRPRQATARAGQPSRLLIVDREEFYDVLAQHVEITRSLVQHLVRRLLSLTEIREER